MTLKQFRKHIQYTNVWGLADMELTFSTAAHKFYSWKSPALLVAAKQVLEVASGKWISLFDLRCLNTHFLTLIFTLRVRIKVRVGSQLAVPCCNNLTRLLAFLLPFPMLQRRKLASSCVSIWLSIMAGPPW